MRLTVVGCSGSMSGPTSAASSYLLQADGTDPGSGRPRTYNVLLDCGPGAFGALMNHLDPAELDLVALSHLHADHIADLIGMHVFRRYHPGGAMGPVPVLAPAGALDRVRGVGGDDGEETYAGEFTFREHTPGSAVTVGPMRVESFEVRHPVPAYGLRVTGPSDRDDVEREVAVGYTGDTDSCRGVEDMARDVDLLLCEAAFVESRQEPRGLHLTGRRAGELAATAGVRRMVLTHLQPWTPPDVVREEVRQVWSGALEVAEAGARWVV